MPIRRERVWSLAGAVFGADPLPGPFFADSGTRCFGYCSRLEFTLTGGLACVRLCFVPQL